MNNDLISRSALKKYARTRISEEIVTNRVILKLFDELIDNAPTVVNENLTTERPQVDGNSDRLPMPQGEWIPITYRPMTEEEEKELCEEFGIKEGSLEDWEKRVFTCKLPDDGQEILVSYYGKHVQEDICSWDEYGCGLENNGDWDGVDAWMPKPEPYKKGGAE